MGLFEIDDPNAALGYRNIRAGTHPAAAKIKAGLEALWVKYDPMRIRTFCRHSLGSRKIGLSVWRRTQYRRPEGTCHRGPSIRILSRHQAYGKRSHTSQHLPEPTLRRHFRPDLIWPRRSIGNFLGQPDDFIFVHNQAAARPIQREWMNWVEEFQPVAAASNSAA
jgi:hypothetical protein